MFNTAFDILMAFIMLSIVIILLIAGTVCFFSNWYYGRNNRGYRTFRMKRKQKRRIAQKLKGKII